MKIPKFLTGGWLGAFCVGATLVLAATAPQADPSIDSDAESLALSEPAELEALAQQYATLDQRLHASVEATLEALGYEATSVDLLGLAFAHDAGLSGRAAALAIAPGDRRSRPTEPDYEIVAADRSWKIVITSVPATEYALPAAPTR